MSGRSQPALCGCGPAGNAQAAPTDRTRICPLLPLCKARTSFLSRSLRPVSRSAGGPRRRSRVETETRGIAHGDIDRTSRSGSHIQFRAVGPDNLYTFKAFYVIAIFFRNTWKSCSSPIPALRRW